MSEAILNQTQLLKGEPYISLTTFRQNGETVSTPVWFAEANGKFYVTTRANSYKVKRIQNNPQVGFAPCTMQGAVTGQKVGGTARVLPNDDRTAYHALRQKYGLLFILGSPFIYGLGNQRRAYIEITPA